MGYVWCIGVMIDYVYLCCFNFVGKLRSRPYFAPLKCVNDNIDS